MKILKRFDRYSIFILLSLLAFVLQGCGKADSSIQKDIATARTKLFAESPKLMITAPSAVQKGTCLPLIVSSVQTDGTLLIPTQDVDIVLASENNLQIYSDALCANAVVNPSISAGNSYSIYYLNAAEAKPYVLELQSFGYSSASASITSLDATSTRTLSQLVLLGAPKILTGQCTPLTLMAADQHAQAIVSSVNISATLNSDGGAQYYSDSGCSNLITAKVINSGESAETIYFRATAAQNYSLTAQAAGIARANLNITVDPINNVGPNKVILVGHANQAVSSCVPMKVVLTNKANDPTPAISPVPVDLSATSAGNFFSEASCSTSISTVLIPAASSYKDIYFSSGASGNLILTAAATGLVDGFFNLSLSATPTASPVALKWSGPTQFAVGSCVPVGIVAIGANGIPMNVSSSKNITVSGLNSGGFYSDAACAVPAGSVTLDANSSLATLFYKTATPETGIWIASHTGLASASWPYIAQAISSGEPSAVKLSFISSNSGAVGFCLPVSIITQSEEGVAVPVTSSTVLNLSSTGGSFYSDASCSSAASSVPLAANQSAVSAYFKAASVNSYILFAEATGFSLASAALNISPNLNGPAGLVLSGPSALSVNSCIPFAVLSLDSKNRSAVVASNTIVNLSFAGAMAYYSDSGCSTSITSLSIPSGSALSYFYVKGNSVGSHILTAEATGLSIATLPVTVQSGASVPSPARLALSGLPSFKATVCTPFAVTALDGSGSPIVVSSNYTVSLSGEGSGQFYSNASCASTITTTTLASGASQTTIYYKNGSPENLLLMAQATGLLAGSLPVSIIPSTDGFSQLSLAGPSSTDVNICTPFAVVAKNSAGQTVSATSNITASLSGAGAGAFYSDNNCSTSAASVNISAGSSLANVFFKSGSSATHLLVVSAGGVSPGTLPLVVNSVSGAPVPTRLMLSGLSSFQSGSCVPFTMVAADAQGNPLAVGANTVVNFSGAGSGAFYSDASCSVSATSGTILAGSSLAGIYFKAPTAQSLILLAQASGFATGSMPISIQNTPSTAPTGILLSGAQNIFANVCVPYAALSVNSAGVAAPVTSTTAVSLSGNGAGTFYSDANCTTSVGSVNIVNGSSLAGFYFKMASGGNVLFSASATGLALSTMPVSVSSAAAVPVATRLTLVGNPSLQTGTCAAYTAMTVDASGSPVNVTANTSLTLSGNGNGSFYSDSGCNTASSTLNILANNSLGSFYFKTSSPQNLVFAVQATGLSAAALPVSITNASTGAMSLRFSGASSINSGSCVPYAVLTTDSLGNAVNVTSLLTVSLGGAGSGAFFSDSACSVGNAITTATIPNGSSFTFLYYKNDIAQNVLFSATAASYSSSTFPVTVNATNNAPSGLKINGLASVQTNSCAPYSVTAIGVNGFAQNVSSNTTVNLGIGGGGTLFSDASCSVSATSLVILAGSSSKTFYYKSPVASSSLISVSATGLSQYDFALQAVAPSSGGGGGTNPTPLTPVKLDLAGATNILTNYCSGPFTLMAKDSNGIESVVTSTKNISVNSGSVTAQIFTNSACTTPVTTLVLASGQSNLQFWIKDTQAETISVQVAEPSLVSAALSINVIQTALLSISAATSGVWQAFYYNGQGALADQILTITNMGQTQALNLQAGTPPGSSFSYKGGTFPGQGGSCSAGLNLAPGAKCTMVIRFQPSSATNFSTTTSITYSDGLATRTATIALAGQGNDNLLVKQVATGANHSCFLYSDMTVKCFGNNSSGQLGVGNTVNIGQALGSTDNSQTTPIVSSAVQITAGDSHTCALIADGSVLCWGSNAYGQLGTGTPSNVGDTGNSTFVASPLNYASVNLGTGRKAVQIASGAFHNCALLDNSTIKCWGSNSAGQLGYEDTLSRGASAAHLGNNLPVVNLGTGQIPISVATGGYHSCALMSSGAVKCWGQNGYGQLALGDSINRGDAVGTMGDNLPVANIGGVKVQSLGLGLYHSCAIVAIPNQINNAVKCWGRNSSGQLGYGDTSNRGTSPLQVGGNLAALTFPGVVNPLDIRAGTTHTCVKMDNGFLYCWGSNGVGQLGVDSTNLINNSASSARVFLSSTSALASYDVGGSHNCAILNDSTVKCWGDNSFGQLALRHGKDMAPSWGTGGVFSMNSLPESKAATFGYATSVAMTNSQMCATWKTGDVSCWGSATDTYDIGSSSKASSAMNFYSASANSSYASQVFGTNNSSSSNFCLQMKENKLLCWGVDSYRRFSGGGGFFAHAPHDVTLPGGKSLKKMSGHLYAMAYLMTDGTLYFSGYNNSQYSMGGYCPSNSYCTFNNSLLTGVLDVSLSENGGSSFGCAALGANGLNCWGHNGYGQIGNNTSTPVTSSYNISSAVLGGNAIQVSTGMTHTCVLIDDAGTKSIKCWGRNNSGQLADGTLTNNANAATAVAVDFGAGLTPVQLVSGSQHNCAILSDSSVKCWGLNSSGQLGIGSTANQGGTPGTLGGSMARVLLPLGFKATKLYANEKTDSMCVIGYLNNNPFLSRLYCWGNNSQFNLGNGNNTSVGTTAAQMGSALQPIINTNTQLVDANSSDYRAPGTYTYTVPDGINQIYVQSWGGGSSGGNSVNSSAYYGGSGGGGGGYVAKLISVSPGQTFNLTVGKGGLSSYYTSGPSNGAASTFGALSAGGGSYGTGSNGGAGGVSTGGDVNISGQSGSGNLWTAAGAGWGGASKLGGLGGFARMLNGEFPGGGGAISSTSGTYIIAGSAGANGRVLVTTVTNFSPSASGGSDFGAPGSYIYKIPANVYSVRVQVWGAGGGGGQTNGSYGSGGGAGGYADYIFNVSPGQSLYAFVGAGGVGSDTTTGGTGQMSSVGYNGVSIVANGGYGGTWSTQYCGTPANSCAGGTATGGYLNMDGGSGTNPYQGGTGAGGDAYLGGAGGIGCPAGGSPGNGVFPGGGGGGNAASSCATTKGGDGANGRVLITPIQ